MLEIYFKFQIPDPNYICLFFFIRLLIVSFPKREVDVFFYTVIILKNSEFNSNIAFVFYYPADPTSFDRSS